MSASKSPVEILFNNLKEIASRKSIETYKPVGAPLGLEAYDQRLWKLLGECSEHSHETDGVLISAVVVNYEEGVPGGQFFEIAKKLGYRFRDPLKFWTKHLRLVHETYSKPILVKVDKRVSAPMLETR